MQCEGSLLWYSYLNQAYQVASYLLLEEWQQKSKNVVRGNKWCKENADFYGEIYHPLENATFSVTCSHQTRWREDLCSLHLGRALTPNVQYLVSLSLWIPVMMFFCFNSLLFFLKNLSSQLVYGKSTAPNFWIGWLICIPEHGYF